MAKGRKTGGRQKGSRNHITSAAKEAFLAAFGRLEGDLESWVRRGAEGELQPLMVKGSPVLNSDGEPVMIRTGADPLRAADIIVRMAEYHFPKLGRSEVTGPEGGPLEFVIRDIAREES